VLPICYVCWSSLGTSHNVRTRVWLAHKCPNHIHDMGKLIFIQFKNFIKQTKVLVKETK